MISCASLIFQRQPLCEHLTTPAQQPSFWKSPHQSHSFEQAAPFSSPSAPMRSGLSCGMSTAPAACASSSRFISPLITVLILSHPGTISFHPMSGLNRNRAASVYGSGGRIGLLASFFSASCFSAAAFAAAPAALSPALPGRRWTRAYPPTHLSSPLAPSEGNRLARQRTFGGGGPSCN
jgi:hypothetical protein